MLSRKTQKFQIWIIAVRIQIFDLPICNLHRLLNQEQISFQFLHSLTNSRISHLSISPCTTFFRSHNHESFEANADIRCNRFDWPPSPLQSSPLRSLIFSGTPQKKKSIWMVSSPNLRLCRSLKTISMKAWLKTQNPSSNLTVSTPLAATGVITGATSEDTTNS